MTSLTELSLDELFNVIINDECWVRMKEAIKVHESHAHLTDKKYIHPCTLVTSDEAQEEIKRRFKEQEALIEHWRATAEHWKAMTAWLS